MIFIIVPIIIGFLLYIFFQSGWYVRLRLYLTPLTPIEKVEDGARVKICGDLVAKEDLLEAPLSGELCIAYEVSVQEHGKKNFNLSLKVREVGEFCLKDGNQRIFIDQNCKKKIAYNRDKNYSSGTFDDAISREEAFLKRHGESSVGILGFNKRLSYEEGRLIEGQSVAILGIAHWEWAEDHGIKEPFKKVLVMSAPANSKLYITDEF